MMNLLQLLDRPAVAWLAAAVLAGLTVAAQLVSLGTPDMGFLLYAAGRVLDGARLYRDIIEINPPLIVFLNLPIAAAARALDVSEFAAYRLVTAAVLVALLLLCRAVLPDLAPAQPRFRRGLLLALVVVLFPLVAEDFGEREHLVLAALMPYLLVVAARQRHGAVSSRIGLAAGLLAGVSIALKPHFAVVWIAVEAYHRATQQPGRRYVTPELRAVLGSLAVYAAAVAVITPEYVSIATQLGVSYNTYLQVPWGRLVALGPGAPLVWFALLAAVVARRHDREPRVVTLLAIATVGCFAAGVAQQKGLRYHFYPALGLAVVLLTFTVMVLGRPFTRLVRLYRVVGGVVLGIVFVAAIGRMIVTAVGGTAAERRFREETLTLADEIRERAGGEAVAVLSYHIASAFPLINYAGVPFASRFPHLWLLPASYWNELGAEAPLRYRAPDSMRPPERLLNQAVRDDILGWRPRLLLVLRPAADARPPFLRRIDYLSYFQRQPELAEFLRSFCFVGKRGEYDLYQRQAALEAVRMPRPAEPLRRSASSTALQANPNTISCARK